VSSARTQTDPGRSDPRHRDARNENTDRGPVSKPPTKSAHRLDGDPTSDRETRHPRCAPSHLRPERRSELDDRRAQGTLGWSLRHPASRDDKPTGVERRRSTFGSLLDRVGVAVGLPGTALEFRSVPAHRHWSAPTVDRIVERLDRPAHLARVEREHRRRARPVSSHPIPARSRGQPCRERDALTSRHGRRTGTRIPLGHTAARRRSHRYASNPGTIGSQ
jgi:hypothetical protein